MPAYGNWRRTLLPLATLEAMAAGHSRLQRRRKSKAREPRAPLREERGRGQGNDLGRDRNINRWPQFSTDGQSLMHWMLHEGLEAVFVNLLCLVVGREHFLLDQVVEARPPLACSQTGSGGAVVYHVSDATGMHVGIKGINGFNDRFVTHLAIGMAIFEQEIHLSHHHRCVEAGCLRVERNI